MEQVIANVRAIFDQALEIESAEERVAYLVQACGTDLRLREEVETLLSAHAAAGAFLEPPAAVGPDLEPLLLTPPGTVIGRYKLLEPIGEGGYGTVFMAEQTTPVHRKVALKIIKAGMDTRQVIARFEAERQALALMDHPNIARVFDAGVTDTGRPYFVMELVKGTSITKYCDEHRVELRQRLELFTQVCQAVQHAHQKGIIHRDIKPCNVLVALYDGNAVPKVIDFGVAKATGQRLTDRTMFTGFGDVIGTLEYMSPEQAEVNQLDVDTRSDIYSLGVLLYELLTGSTPLERKRVMKAGLLEMLRVVREEEPPRPSTRLSRSEELPAIAACRGLEPRKLSGLVHGELDWIVMKALEKDRARRYETANGFAADVKRYLSDEAVAACPHSTAYRVRKFTRRNKGRLATAALLLACLMTGVVLLAVNNVWLKAEQDRTRAQFDRAQAELGRADGNLVVALEALDEVYLKEIESRGHRQRQLTGADRDFLQKGLDFYQRFARQNGAQSGLHEESAKADRRLGSLWRALQQNREAEAAFVRAIPVFEKLAARSPDVAGHRRELASCLYGLSVVLDGPRQREAEQRSAQALVLWESLASDPSGPPDDRLRLGHCLWRQGQLASVDGRYEEAERTFTRALRLFEKLATDFPQQAAYRYDLAFSHRWLANWACKPTGRFDEAASHQRQAIAILAKLSAEAPANTQYISEWAITLRFMAAVFREARRPEQAQEAEQQAGRVEEKLVEPFRAAVYQRPSDPWTHQALGDVLGGQRRFAEAVSAYREAIRLEPNDAGRHHNLGDALRYQQKFAEAAAEYAEAVRLSDNPYRSYFNLGRVRGHLGQWEEARAAFEAAAARHGPDDFWAWFRWATLSLYADDADAYRRACRGMLDRFGAIDDPQTAERIAKACALAPGFAGGDPAQVMKLVDRTMTGTESHRERKWFEVMKALVDYRAGRFGPAAQRARAYVATDQPHRDAIASCVVAMTEHHLGHSEAARVALASGRQIIATRMPDAGKDETFGDDWHDWLHAQILCREAEQVLKESAAATPKSK